MRPEGLPAGGAQGPQQPPRPARPRPLAGPPASLAPAPGGGAMRPRPAPLVLLMLLLGLGPGLGRPPPPPAPRRALTAPRSAGSRSPRTPGRTAVPSHVDLRLRAPRGRRALRWLAPLPLPRWLRRPEGALRPGPASPVPPRSDLPGGASHGPSGTECPTDQPPPGVGDADNSSKPHAIESSVSRLLPEIGRAHV